VNRSSPTEIAAVLGGGTVLTASWFVVGAVDGVPDWEARTFESVNDLSDALWPATWVPMQLGSFGGALVVVLATYVTTRKPRLTAAALLGSQAAYWSSKIVKRLVARGRPATLLTNVKVRDHASGVGYVSGHSAVAFALAAALTPSMPRRAGSVPLALASIVAFARMYSGAHLPLDVAGGAGLGLLCGTLARWSLGLGGGGLPARVPE
jgi:undecaprenyl-diphosphatase